MSSTMNSAKPTVDSRERPESSPQSSGSAWSDRRVGPRGSVPGGAVARFEVRELAEKKRRPSETSLLAGHLFPPDVHGLVTREGTGASSATAAVTRLLEEIGRAHV